MCKSGWVVLAGQIGYALVPMIARGIMLGPDQPVILHMLDIAPAAEALNGVKMELVDAAFPLLKGTSTRLSFHQYLLIELCCAVKGLIRCLKQVLLQRLMLWRHALE